MNAPTSAISLYVVKVDDDRYFAGFDTEADHAVYVTDPILAKKFTNKFDIKLRQDEAIVELRVDLAQCEVDVSEPFRLKRRT